MFQWPCLLFHMLEKTLICAWEYSNLFRLLYTVTWKLYNNDYNSTVNNISVVKLKITIKIIPKCLWYSYLLIFCWMHSHMQIKRQVNNVFSKLMELNITTLARQQLSFLFNAVYSLIFWDILLNVSLDPIGCCNRFQDQLFLSN